MNTWLPSSLTLGKSALTIPYTSVIVGGHAQDGSSILGSPINLVNIGTLIDVHCPDLIPMPTRYASSGALLWRVLVDDCSLGRCYSPGDFHGVLNHSILSVLIWTQYFWHPICITANQGTDWPSSGAWYKSEDLIFLSNRFIPIVIPDMHIGSPVNLPSFFYLKGSWRWFCCFSVSSEEKR